MFFKCLMAYYLVHNVDTFSETGVGFFSQILFDVKRYQLIVGARDALFRLSLDGLTKLEIADWPATSTTVGLCTAKGQSEEYCRNYIKEIYQSKIIMKNDISSFYFEPFLIF